MSPRTASSRHPCWRSWRRNTKVSLPSLLENAVLLGASCGLIAGFVPCDELASPRSRARASRRRVLCRFDDWPSLDPATQFCRTIAQVGYTQQNAARIIKSCKMSNDMICRPDLHVGELELEERGFTHLGSRPRPSWLNSNVRSASSAARSSGQAHQRVQCRFVRRRHARGRGVSPRNLFPLLRHLQIVERISARVGAWLTSSGFLDRRSFRIWPFVRADLPDEATLSASLSSRRAVDRKRQGCANFVADARRRPAPWIDGRRLPQAAAASHRRRQQRRNADRRNDHSPRSPRLHRGGRRRRFRQPDRSIEFYRADARVDQFSAAARRRRCSRASWWSAPSSAKIPTITARSRSRRSGSLVSVISSCSGSSAAA